MHILLNIILILILLIVVFFGIFRGILLLKINSTKKITFENNVSAGELINSALANMGLTNVKVEIKGLFIKYKIKENVITISKKFYQSNGFNAISLAMQTVAIANIYNTEENAKNKYSSKGILFIISTFLLFISIIFALITTFFFIDFVKISLIVIIVALIIYGLMAFYVYKKRSLIVNANEIATKYIEKINLFGRAEFEKLNMVYSSCKRIYLIDIILNVVYSVYFAIKFVFLKIKSLSYKDKK